MSSPVVDLLTVLVSIAGAAYLMVRLMQLRQIRKQESRRGFEVKLNAGESPAVTKERDDAHG